MVKQNIKESIIQSAQTTFQKHGFKKTTMDEIAYAARKGKSTLYYYFESKEEVFQAVVEKEVMHLRDKIQKAISKTDSAREKLQVYIFTRMDGFQDFGNFYDALKDDYLADLVFIEKMRQQYDKNEIETITSIIKEGVLNKEFKNMNAALTAKTIVIAMKGLEFPVLQEKSKNVFKKEITDLLNILFYGICS
ncbi:transcriptional regulator, TetR family [Mariniphaga anaerophila]|uniref:Transcriptional regulator, TetR family n=1 Tax=Mariniphaga anaerophila TaxID=1484053 RepID=A0A1M5AF27_9BACT|nr:TetR/AcrR family transcriptional regulator [Mariniphaga anaerophila]SHF28745.1 transcriptional regulator, TetR family [Mariniphaga anaerophila]